jgi:hypothetical protein
VNQTAIRELLRKFEEHDARWQQARNNNDPEQLLLCVAEFKQLCDESKQIKRGTSS